MSREQLDVIEREIEKAVEYLLIERMMEAHLVIKGLENVLTGLAESVAAIYEQ